MADNVLSHGNPISYYGVTPITIDSDRTIQYIQYPLLRQGSTILQPGETGVSIPSEWSVTSTGPIFSVSFVVTANEKLGITPEDFSNIFKPTISSGPLQDAGSVSRYELQWESVDPEFSAWNTSLPDDEKEIDLVTGRQQCIVTRPISASDLGQIKSGVVFFSLEPTSDNTFDGLGIGLISVTYKLKKQKVAS